ncbi:autorepressor SdpR family transcription factor [Undibacterium sp. Di24W]|uniref:autorepressor SdpR family transcription factor n=1 Tax=Undibacterium sp. Di24W TaxID=3413033 RepID=UPI003BF013A1
MNPIFKALSDPTRRQVLSLLRDGPLTAGELADQFDVSKPTMSAHFAVLREAELIESSRQGQTVVYYLKLSVLEEALVGFAQLMGINIKAAESIPEVAEPSKSRSPFSQNKGKP